MGRIVGVLWFLSLSYSLSAQSFWTPSDTLNKQRLNTLVIGGGTAAAGSIVGLYSLWYSDYDQSSFHFVNDFANYQGMDKVGHAYTTYSLGYNAYDGFRWAGLSETKSIWYGGLSGWTYLALIEVLDGRSAEWGFSMGDFAFNSIGAGLFISQQLAWHEQRIRLKFSYHPTEYPQYRPELFGNGWTEEWLKDYNGQTYWLSVNPRSFSSGEGWWPEWLNVAGGYGATGMTGAAYNVESNGIPYFTRGQQYYLSLDIDLSKIPMRSHFWKGVFGVINVIKIPAPTLEYRTTDGKLYFHPLYF